MIDRIWAICRNIYLEGFRQKIFIAAVIFAVVLIVLSVFLGPFSLGEISKIVRDFGLAISSLLGIFVIVTIGSSILYRDLERRTIYTIVTRPIRPREIIIGKFFGITLLVISLVFAMSVIQQLVIFLSDGRFDFLILIAPLFFCFEIMIMTGILLFFASFSSAAFSSIMTVVLFIVGHASPDLKLFADSVKSPFLKTASTFFYYLLPNLENFNLRQDVVYRLPIHADQALFIVCYGIGYVVLLLFLSVIIFEGREFK
jgi:ABC-type transport system involved in multi-copper enzyme maturation permease subunit